MTTLLTGEQLEERVIVRVDNPGAYENSGYLVLEDKDTGMYYLTYFSHCSCNGTWDSFTRWSWGTKASDGGYLWPPYGADWQGTMDELIKLATERRDPNMPERPADPEDYNFKGLMTTYEKVLEYLIVQSGTTK